ncbi:MAG: gliding motility-associated C-terminal domain-containing protein [Bacteroidales bacterium]|jgi:gliding motility-associated-like protein|nr:gliding motility-associated C-terminal domain-containing protein [Bacteroidales bacterium]
MSALKKIVWFCMFVLVGKGLFALPVPDVRDTLSPNTGLRFIANKGQLPAHVLFKANLRDAALYAERDGLTFVLRVPQKSKMSSKNATRNDDDHVHAIPNYKSITYYNIQFTGATCSTIVTGLGSLPFYYNYFRGNDPALWATRVPLFRQLRYNSLYPGIDMLVYQQGDYLKYEFVLAPYSEPNVVQMTYSGEVTVSLHQGTLVLTTPAGQIKEMSPKAFQILPDGDTVFVDCRFKKINKNSIGFEVGNYRHDLLLVIDPTLVFSTYSGSYSDNWGYTATYDAEGNAYAGGISFGIGYPIPNPNASIQPQYGGGQCDISISKFSPDGKNLLYSTYLGGMAAEMPHSLIVNRNNELFILGTTGSADFPVTYNVICSSFKGGDSVQLSNAICFEHGSDMIVCKLSSDGTQLLASTFLGGSGNDGLNTANLLMANYADEVRGEINIDDQSNVYIASCTSSKDFPVTTGSFQSTYGGGEMDGCVLKLNYNLSNIIWASYLGGDHQDAAYSIEPVPDHSIFVCGGTASANFPVTPNSMQTTFGGGISGSAPDGFAMKINEFGNQLLASTFLGSTLYDQAYMIKTNRQGMPYLFGQTRAKDLFWVNNTTWYTPDGGQFVCQLTPTLDKALWSTAFGSGRSRPDISPTALMVDACGTVYLSGWGSNLHNGLLSTKGLPVTTDAIQNTTDGHDFYFLCLTKPPINISYATYFGSPNNTEHVDGGTSRFDKKGCIYQAICADCGGYDHQFPVTHGVWSEYNNSSNCNLALIKIDFQLPAVIADFSVPPTACAPFLFSPENYSLGLGSSTRYVWDFGDGTSDTATNPTHLYTTAGHYQIKLTVFDSLSCNLIDTISFSIVILGNTFHQQDTIFLCPGEAVQLGIPADHNMTYRWVPEEGLDNPRISNPTARPARDITYVLYISNDQCTDTIVQPVHISESILLHLPTDTTICKGDSLHLTAAHVYPPNTRFFWSESPDFDVLLPTDTFSPHLHTLPDTTTTYYCMTKTNDCIWVKKIKITLSFIDLKPVSSVLLCEGMPKDISLQSTGSIIAHCLWKPESLVISGQGTAHVSIMSLHDTLLTVIAANSRGCTDSLQVHIRVSLSPFPQGFEAWSSQQVIEEGDTVTLFATTYSRPDYHYTWEPNHHVFYPYLPITPATPDESTIFTITITEPLGCTRSDTVLIKVLPVLCEYPYIFLPNAFTPNEDGKNDILLVRGTNILKIHLLIYDRWGECMFESHSREIGWDGTYKGHPCQPGVYDYYLEVTCKQEQKLIRKGNVTLIR